MNSKITFILVFLMTTLSLKAQVATDVAKEDVTEEIVYRDVDVMAKYRGGYSVFLKQLETATKNCKKGKLKKKDAVMIVEFVVNKDGKVSDFQVLKQDSDLCENDVRNAVYKSNQWIPARVKGKAVSCYIQFTINLVNGSSVNDTGAYRISQQ